MSASHSTPLRRRPSANDDLAQSMRHLSLAAKPPAKPPAARSPSTTRSPSVASMASAGGRSGSVYRSPSVASNRGGGAASAMAQRSPLLGSGRESRAGAATPTLLRKASLNSLHGGNNTSSTNLRASSCSPAPTQRRSPSGRSPGGRSPGGLSANGSSCSFFEPLPEEPTAEFIAQQHFEAELTRHAADLRQPLAALGHTDTVVILQDSCYGHRFARPRTSRASLSTIVERPERLQACVVGVSAAYVRLGGRHADGAHMPHPRRNGGAIASVPFHIRKTTRQLSLQSAAVTNVHGAKWMDELKLLCESAEAKLALNGKELQREAGGSNNSSSDTPEKLHEGDLYLCAESLDALQGALGGVCEAVDAVFGRSPPLTQEELGGLGLALALPTENHNTGPKRAFVGIRPPGHHCSATWPSGFCWINNVHVGIMHAMLTHGLTHAAIVDFDLHHGDGSQAVAWQHNARGRSSGAAAAAWKKASIGYFSLHDINSFPCESGDGDKVKNASICIENAHGQNVWNVHLEPWKTEAEFWRLYENKYVVLLDKVRAFLQTQTAQRQDDGAQGEPKAAIFISAGFDASEWETPSMQRHKVNVPTEFYARFTRDIVRLAEEEGTSVEGRVISVLEGGYSDRALYSGVLSHLSGPAGGEGVEGRERERGRGMGREERGMRSDEDEREGDEDGIPAYNKAWWTAAELDRIEAMMAPPPPPAEGRAAVSQPTTTYSSPTTASKAKVAQPKVRRSASGLAAMYSRAASPMSRPPTPPPPEVSWTVAMHELSKLLIPWDRSTTSCTAEELTVEPRRRGGGGGSVSQSTAGTRASQRERRPVKPFGTDDKTGPTARGRPKQPARRLSVASEAGSSSAAAALNVRKTRPATAMGVTTTTGSRREASVQSTARVPLPKTGSSNRSSSSSSNNRSSSIHSNTTATTATTATSTRRSSTSVPSGRTSAMSTDQPSGVRRIKINVVTTAQREAREAREAREGREGREGREKAKAGVASLSATCTLPAVRIEATSGSTTDESPLLTPSTEADSSTAAATSPLRSPSAMRRADLPRFTATSTIPFARK